MNILRERSGTEVRKKNYICSVIKFVIFVLLGVDAHPSESCSMGLRSQKENLEEVVRWIEDHDGRLPRRCRDLAHKSARRLKK